MGSEFHNLSAQICQVQHHWSFKPSNESNTLYIDWAGESFGGAAKIVLGVGI